MPAPTIQITVRLPDGLYKRVVAAVLAESEDGRPSMNAYVVRALESALVGNEPGEPNAIAHDDRETGRPSPAQTRTSEESSRSSSEAGSSEAGGSRDPVKVAPAAKESASPGPARQGSGRGPRRSAKSKNSHGARGPVVDPTEKKEAAATGPNPESEGEAGFASDLSRTWAR